MLNTGNIALVTREERYVFGENSSIIFSDNDSRASKTIIPFFSPLVYLKVIQSSSAKAW